MPRILVVAPNWIGDALMAQPLLARLRSRTPGAQIDVLAPGWVAPVVRRMAEVDDVIAVPFRHKALQLGSRWKTARDLKARGYDEAIVLPNSWKSALLPFFAGIPVSTGYLGEFRYGLLNDIHRNAAAAMSLHYAILSEPPGTRRGAPGRTAPAGRGAGDRRREAAFRPPWALWCVLPRRGVRAGQALAVLPGIEPPARIADRHPGLGQ